MGSGVKVGEVYALVRLEKGTFNADIAAVGAGVTGLGGKFDALIRKAGPLGPALKSMFTGIGIGSGIAAFNALSHAAHELFDFLGDSIKAASDMNETITKAGVIFGAGAKEMEEWASTADRSMGLSKNAALAAAANFGNLFVSLQTAPEKVAPMSKALVELAADLASFNNISVAEALQKLQSGIVGQARPLRELGVAIDEAAVDQEALRLGFVKTNGVMSQAAKVQGRYSLIFKQTATAQGDFARTADGLANTQRVLAAEMENVTEEIGTALLPVMVDLAHFARDTLIPAIKDVIHWFGEVGQAARDIGQAWATVGLNFGSMGDRLHKIADDTGRDFDEVKNRISYNMRNLGMDFEHAADEAETAFRRLAPDYKAAISEIENHPVARLRSAEEIAALAAEAVDGVVGAYEDGAGDVEEAAKTGLQAPTVQAMQDARKEAVKIATGIPGAVADALVKGQSDVESGMQELKDLMSDEWTDAARIAYYKGVLSSTELANGLKSKDADVRDAAKRLKATAEEQLRLLESGAADAAVDTGTTLAEQLRLQDDEISRGMADALRGAKGNLQFSDSAYGWGENIAESWVDGFVFGLYRGLTPVHYVLSQYSGALAGSSPPKKGPLRTIDRGAANIAKAWVESFTAGLAAFKMPDLMPSLASLTMPGLGGPMLPAGAAGSAGDAPRQIVFGDFNFYGVGNDVGKEAARAHQQEIMDIVGNAIQEESSRFPNRPGLPS